MAQFAGGSWKGPVRIVRTNVATAQQVVRPSMSGLAEAGAARQLASALLKQGAKPVASTSSAARLISVRPNARRVAFGGAQVGGAAAGRRVIAHAPGRAKEMRAPTAQNKARLVAARGPPIRRGIVAKRDLVQSQRQRPGAAVLWPGPSAGDRPARILQATRIAQTQVDTAASDSQELPAVDDDEEDADEDEPRPEKRKAAVVLLARSTREPKLRRTADVKEEDEVVKKQESQGVRVAVLKRGARLTRPTPAAQAGTREATRAKSATDELDECEAELNEMEEEIAKAQATIQACEEKQANLANSGEAMQARAVELAHRIEEVKKKRKELHKEMETMKNQDVELKQTKKELQKEEQTLNAELLEVDKQEESTQAEQEVAVKELEDLVKLHAEGQERGRELRRRLGLPDRKKTDLQTTSSERDRRRQRAHATSQDAQISDRSEEAVLDEDLDEDGMEDVEEEIICEGEEEEEVIDEQVEDEEDEEDEALQGDSHPREPQTDIIQEERAPPQPAAGKISRKQDAAPDATPRSPQVATRASDHPSSRAAPQSSVASGRPPKAERQQTDVELASDTRARAERPPRAERDRRRRRDAQQDDDHWEMKSEPSASRRAADDRERAPEAAAAKSSPVQASRDRRRQHQGGQPEEARITDGKSAKAAAPASSSKRHDKGQRSPARESTKEVASRSSAGQGASHSKRDRRRDEAVRSPEPRDMRRSRRGS
mmetsp:Transcript_61381/g.146244  ORF Transcript_61381/g.146244 Transcript_61381/m.146244 type:complete len:719 (+) Transcript_61381:106-2262(+)